MATTISHLQQQLKDLEAAHAAALLANDIGGATSLHHRIESLSALLDAPQRKAEALRDLAALREQATQAQGGVDAAQGVVNELQGRHAEAVAQISEDRALTASAILAAAKRGETIAACSPDRGPATALEAALALAEAEHQAAVGVLAAVQEKVAAGEQALCFAERDCASLVFELSLRDFAQAANQAMASIPGYGVENVMYDAREKIYAEA